ncbi:MAG TPA: serine/threonine-protein kinase [Polyangiaceae bacterium]|jgi:serine/threonine-protein kinase|nr:serine/threonine-protein kinase [Polyangiaceae bacterium]
MRGDGSDASQGGHSSKGAAVADRTPPGKSGAEAAARSSGTQEVQPSPIDQLEIGAIVNGKYRINSILGRGSMGVVTECEHIELRERVALKFLLTRGNVAGEDFRVRFMREAQLSAKLKGLHIARVVDVGVWLESLPYMVMEYLEGTDLAHVLRAAGRLPADLALEYTVQICEGVAEAHALGVVHRDLKPSNVFVTQQADGSDLIKILDFGVSKWDVPDRDAGEGTQAGLILGSPKYMAPEQMFTASKVDARADIWSIGAVLYQMITGRPPYDFPTFAQTFAELASDRPPPGVCALAPEVSPELEGVILQCFQRTPDKRVQSVAELAGALLEAVGSPHAAATRARIESILASRASRDASLAGQSSSSRIRVAQHEQPIPAWLRSSTTSVGSAMASSSSMRKAEEARRAGGNRKLAAIGVVAIGGALFAAFAGPSLLKDAPPVEVHPATAVALPAAATALADALPSAEPETSASSATTGAASFLAGVPGGSADPPSTESHSTTHAAFVHVHAPPPPRVVASAAAPLPPSPQKPAEAVKKNCDPPYVLSADGVKTYKPECF